MVERGIVKYFDEREGKKYGFVRVLNDAGQPTREEIFFHYHDGKTVTSNNTDGVTFDDTWRFMPMPQKGDVLVFERKPGKKGKPKACPWSYASDWDSEVNWFETKDEVDFGPDDFDDKDDIVSTGEVYNRAYACFGNHEMAREATEMYPGDFV